MDTYNNPLYDFKVLRTKGGGEAYWITYYCYRNPSRFMHLMSLLNAKYYTGQR